MESSRSTAASLRSECSPLTPEKRRQLRRKLYVRRCARTMTVLVALAALSVTALHLRREDRRGFKWLPDDGWLTNLFGDGIGNNAAGKKGQLRYCKLT